MDDITYERYLHNSIVRSKHIWHVLIVDQTVDMNALDRLRPENIGLLYNCFSSILCASSVILHFISLDLQLASI